MVSVDISMHDTAGNQPRATAGAEGTSSWLSIRQGETEITIFASRDKSDALRMIADAFNDTFQRQAEPEPAPAMSPPDDDMPF